MFAVAKKECFSLLRGFKAIFIMIVFIGFSYLVADFVKTYYQLFFTPEMGTENVATYGLGLRFLVFGLGFLFVCLLSHDLINREIENQTIRFLVTKTSRFSIVFGKYLGVLAFWIILLFLSYLPIFFISKHWDFNLFAGLITHISFVIGWTVLFSAMIPRPGYTLLFGIIASIVFPIFSILSQMYDNPFWLFIRYVSPYTYLLKGGAWIWIPFGLGVFFVAIAAIIFNRKDL